MAPDPLEVQALFARHYFLFAALATLGGLQIAVSVGGFRGMWLLPGRLKTRFAGALLIAAGTALFFLMPLWVEGPWAAGSVEADSSTRTWGKADWKDLGAARNINDIDGGLSGTGQATWFPISTAIAVAISIVAGAMNLKLFPPQRLTGVDAGEAAIYDDVDGLELMADRSYRAALPMSWRRFRRDLPTDAAELLAKADRWSISAWVWRRLRG